MANKHQVAARIFSKLSSGLNWGTPLIGVIMEKLYYLND